MSHGFGDMDVLEDPGTWILEGCVDDPESFFATDMVLLHPEKWISHQCLL